MTNLMKQKPTTTTQQDECQIIKAVDQCRVAVVDDHAMVRQGLRNLLLAFDDLKWVGEAQNGQEALALCDQVQPDVILMDIAMSEMDGVAATRLISRKYPDIRIIALTNFKNEKMVQKMKKAGAVCFLLKNVSVEELVSAIRKTCKGSGAT